MSYCKNCGNNIENDRFCSKCGQITDNTVEKKQTVDSTDFPTASPINKKPKSLSFIVISVLSIIGILSLLLNGYFKYYSLSVGSYYSDDFYKSANYFELADSVFLGVLAILLMLSPAILYVINLKVSKNLFCWISLGCESVGFLYVLISSLILCDNFETVNTGSYNGLYYGYLRRFEGFQFLFYLVLIIFALMIVITIFDALNKPLIRSKKGIS